MQRVRFCNRDYRTSFDPLIGAVGDRVGALRPASLTRPALTRLVVLKQVLVLGLRALSVRVIRDLGARL